MKAVLFAFILSLPAFAQPSYVKECRKAALSKLEYKAQAQGGVLDERTVAVSYIDDRWYNPSKYVWFAGMATKEDGTRFQVQTLTQKSYFPLKACF